MRIKLTQVLKKVLVLGIQRVKWTANRMLMRHEQNTKRDAEQGKFCIPVDVRMHPLFYYRTENLTTGRTHPTTEQPKFFNRTCSTGQFLLRLLIASHLKVI